MTATLPWGHFTCILITNPQNNPEKKYHCLHLELRKQNNWLTFPSPTTSERQHHLTCQRCLVFMCWAELVPICGEWFEISKLLVSLLKTPSHFLGSSNWMYWLHIDSERSLSSVQFSRSVVSDSLRSHELQHARPPCPSPTPGACSNSCPLSQWCHPAILSSVIPFSSLFNLSQHQGLF